MSTSRVDMRVGDGRRINIWHDRWLHSPTTYAVQTLVRVLEGNATVSVLIDETTKWWNIPLVEEVFQ